MKLLSVLLVTAGIATAASYTATSLQTSTNGFANIIALNNKGQVLGDACDFVGSYLYCYGSHRYPAVWSSGVMTPLPIPTGYAYIAVLSYYGINDSGTVVGTLQTLGANNVPYNHVFVWTNGVPTALPDAPIPGSGTICSTSGSSSSFGINAAGHIVGSTTYPSVTPGGPSCSGYWLYNGASFRLLPIAIPSICTSPPLPPGYAPGVGVGFGAAINDADLVLQTLDNFFCGPPYVTPGFPSADPFLVQPTGSTSFLPLGTLAAATGSYINDLGDVLGYYTSPTHLVFWDKSGVHDLGPSGYGHLNQVGQVVYLGPGTNAGGASSFESGSFYLWQNGISTPLQLPAGLFGPDDFPVPSALNDAGQFIASEGQYNYLLTPSGPCGQDVTSQVQITRTGFRYNHSTGLFALIGSVTNTSGSPIPGPISLVVDNLSTNASLFGISGDTLCAAPQGSPYINIGNIGAGQDFEPGASISGSISFIDTAQTGITYNLRVLAGPGGR
ncbi:MAG TPA: hypothetical protein VMH80_24870 [Bryobacteraceae bacterium]|nr:hypothetical protein [Bryobacteraceae bacterium]